MVSYMLTLTSTFSRLNLLPRSSIPYTVKALRTLQYWNPQKWSPQNFPFKRISAHISTPQFNSKQLQLQSFGIGDDLVVLGIETSCDDTAAAVVRSSGEILSQVVSSQADLVAQFGGVAPKMAEEAHLQVIDQVVQEALDKANLTEKDLSAVAVTIGPGLSLCLRVGVRKARKIAGSFNVPIIGIYHMEARALVARLNERDLQFPFMALLISGGHNLLILACDLGQYIQLGTTIDDAIGEAYGKTAKWLGLDLRGSGGLAIEELAREGDAESVKFSIPMKQHKDCNFSFAGLKTQVRLAIQLRNINAEIPISSVSCQDRSSRADIAASFQRTAVLHLEERCGRAIEWALNIVPSIKYLVASGGVASNKYVRTRLDQVVRNKGLQLVCPPPSLCTDNGVMVACTGIENFRRGRFEPPPPANEPEDYVFLHSTTMTMSTANYRANGMLPTFKCGSLRIQVVGLVDCPHKTAFAFGRRLFYSQLCFFHVAQPLLLNNSKRMTWSVRSSVDGSGLDPSSINGTDGGTRLLRAILAFRIKLSARLQEIRKDLPLKVLFFLVGFYCATAFATVIGQTGDWDILSAALAVAVVEGIGALMYKASIPLFDKIRGLIAIFNYWKAGLSLGLFLDSFKY